MLDFNCRTSHTTGTNKARQADADISLKLGRNPAYEPPTLLHRNAAYEDTTHEGPGKQDESPVNTTEPTYDIIQQISRQIESVCDSKAGDEYNKLSRELPN